MTPKVHSAGLALLVAACTPGPARAQPAEPVPPAVRPVAAARPVGLVGSWQVRAAGEAPGAVLRLDEGLTLTSRCGDRHGSWRADVQGLFVGYTYAFSRACLRPGNRPNPTWLATVRGFRAHGTGWRLTSRSGRTVARLLPLPARTRNAGGSGHRPPRAPFAPMREVLAAPPALPSALRPASASDLQGRWVPTALTRRPLSPAGAVFRLPLAPLPAAPPDPYLLLAADGSWRSSDGCNQGAGRWVTGTPGRVLAVSGVSTAMYCPGAPVDRWLTDATGAGLDGGILVLVDPRGRVTGRLRRG